MTKAENCSINKERYRLAFEVTNASAADESRGDECTETSDAEEKDEHNELKWIKKASVQ